MSVLSTPATVHPADIARAELLRLRDAVGGVRGALVASVDGWPFAAVLPEHDEDATAAIVAASLGLGRRLADLAGEGEMQEIVVRSQSGYVVIYAVGTRGVLTVLTTRVANLALLHLTARDVAAALAPPLATALAARTPSAAGAEGRGGAT